jgi:chemotaxis methyl-accepting protein methylase
MVFDRKGDDSFRWKAEPEKANHSRAIQNNGVDPVMIRAYQAENKGATAFFRNRPFLNTFMDLLFSLTEERCRILFHASSVGAEPYSFALQYLHSKYHSRNIEIYATDINASFLDIARKGEYPADLLQGMTAEEKGWFEHDGKVIRVPRAARDVVRFLPPMSFVDGKPGMLYDAVLVMNAFTYVSPDQQGDALLNISRYANHLIGLTAFHPDTIQRDMSQIEFIPYLKEQEKIHAAWGDRITDNNITPGSLDYSWRLPKFNRNQDGYEYKFCSIFIRD